MTEQQQIEYLKLWWKKNGAATLIIFAITFIVSIAWHFWTKHREIKLERGSFHYEYLLNALVNDNNQVAIKEANLLKSNYQHTPYAGLATLILARDAVYKNNYDDAKKDLTWVMKHGNSASLREIARIRLARIEIEQQHPQQAITLLAKINDQHYLPLINETRGDSYAALQEWDKAQQAYQQALHALPHPGLRPLLPMKLDNVGISPNMLTKNEG